MFKFLKKVGSDGETRLGYLENGLRRYRNWLLGSHDAVRLWVDDLRPPPKGWYWAITNHEAADVLVSHYVERLSLDHDLGPGGEAYTLVKWLVRMREEFELSFWPECRPLVHSAPPVGRQNIEATIDRYGRYAQRRKT